MDATVVRPPGVHDARDLAQILLRDLAQRWRHTIGVARRAEELLPAVSPAEREVLLAAAWLHDIGYSQSVAETGFHPLDGARFLERHRWPARISVLVAHHSGAAFVAAARGLLVDLAAYPREESETADALTYADLTTAPDGTRTTVPRRLADILHRHGPGSPHALVHHHRAPYLLDVAGRVEARLRAAAPR